MIYELIPSSSAHFYYSFQFTFIPTMKKHWQFRRFALILFCGMLLYVLFSLPAMSIPGCHIHSRF